MNKDSIKEFISKGISENVNEFIKMGFEGAVEEILKTVIESIMKAERTAYLSESENNKGNGYYERIVKYLEKYLRIKIPRDRNAEFKSELLEYLRKEKEKMDQLAFKLYVKGLTTRDIENVLKEVFDENYSATQISLITQGFMKEKEEWLNKKLESSYYVLFIDAIQISVRRTTVEKESFYIVMGLRKDCKREILGVYNMPTESSEGWREVFKDLKNRGLEKVLLIVSDEITSIQNVSKQEFKGVQHQFCITHKKRNLHLAVRASDKPRLEEDLKDLFKIGDARYTKEEAWIKFKAFKLKWKLYYPSVVNKLPDSKFDDYFAYLSFPYQIQSMIYTTNWIERLNKSIRKTERNRNSMPSVDSAFSLLIAFISEQENNYYLKYPVSSFFVVSESLDSMF